MTGQRWGILLLRIRRCRSLLRIRDVFIVLQYEAGLGWEKGVYDLPRGIGYDYTVLFSLGWIFHFCPCPNLTYSHSAVDACWKTNGKLKSIYSPD